MAQGIRKTSKKREQPEGGTHMARLVGITDLGEQPSFVYQGKEIASQFKREFTYELVNAHMSDGRPFHVSEEVKESDFEGKGITSTMMARVRKLDPSNESNNGSDLKALLGKPCMVTVSINDSGYPKVSGQAAVTGVPMGMEVAELQNEAYFFDMDEPDMDLFFKFPEFKQDKIKAALNLNETKLAQELANEDQY